MKARKLISNGVLYNAWMFCTRGSLLWEETGTPGENPRVQVGDKPYPLTYNHCRSRGLNSGHIGEKPVRYHCVIYTVFPRYIASICSSLFWRYNEGGVITRVAL